jgi:hypothetical protein
MRYKAVRPDVIPEKDEKECKRAGMTESDDALVLKFGTRKRGWENPRDSVACWGWRRDKLLCLGENVPAVPDAHPAGHRH